MKTFKSLAKGRVRDFPLTIRTFKRGYQSTVISVFITMQKAEEISCSLLPELLFSFNTFFLSIFFTKTFKSLAKFQVRDFPLTF